MLKQLLESKTTTKKLLKNFCKTSLHYQVIIKVKKMNRIYNLLPLYRYINLLCKIMNVGNN